MSDNYYESKKLANVFIVRNDPQLNIPESIHNELKSIGKNLVAVIPGDSKKLSFFITNASKILFVRLFLEKSSLDDSFFTSLRKTLQKLEMSNLFSTGLCFKDEICVWEGVFEFDFENPPETSHLENEFSGITHVNKVKLEKIELQL